MVEKMNPDESTVKLAWSARKSSPLVLLYLAGVFLVFMGLAHFVFHSADAVKALFLAAVGSGGAIAPSLLGKTEYVLTESGLAKRPFASKEPGEFKGVFSWDELSYFTPTSSGFKFYKKMDGTHGPGRFFKLHFSDAYSGEFRVERGDMGRVRAILDEQGIPATKTPTRGRIT